jgi:hypothetical protein
MIRASKELGRTSRALLVGLVYGIVVACGGSVSTIPDGASSGNGGTSGTSGAGTSGGASGSSGQSSGGTSGAPGCTTSSVAGKRACVPGTGKANVAITIDVDAPDGCLGCFTTLEPCTPELQGKKIVIAMKAKTCPPPGDLACPAVCLIPSVKCTLPPLAPGTYQVEVEGESPRTGFRPRELVVTEKATAGFCTLPQTPTPLEPNRFDTTCQDDVDCRTATFGNLCQPCACPNGAIAKSAGDAYEAASREGSSHCVSPDRIACAACVHREARCVKTSGGPGTCTLQP